MPCRWLACAVLVVSGAGEMPAQAQQGTIDVTIVARTPNAVHVEERFTLGSSAAPIELEVLTRPCMVIENMRVTRDGVVLGGEEARRGPWMTWRDTTVPRGDSLRLTVDYDVWLGGSRTIPLALLAGRQSAGVTVGARFAPRAALAGDVEFPRMSRQAPREWSGRYVAMPSFVKVGGFAFACDRLPPPGDNGGLVWRFTLLIGVMASWVPLYLRWARRAGDAA